MNELIATSSGEIRARDDLLGYWWHEKSKVDKEIAELKAKIAQLEDNVAFWKNKYNDCKRELNLLKDTTAFYNGGKE